MDSGDIQHVAKDLQAEADAEIDNPDFRVDPVLKMPFSAAGAIPPPKTVSVSSFIRAGEISSPFASRKAPERSKARPIKNRSVRDRQLITAP